jgi:hypothetical protein
VSAVVVDRFVVPRFVTAGAAETWGRGDRLPEETRTVLQQRGLIAAVLVVSQNCRFCNDSAEFYRELVSLKQTTNGRFETIFVGFHKDDAKAFLTTNRLPAEDLRSTPQDLRKKVRGTPTLLIVDQTGLIRGAWMGRLSSRQERDVVSAATGTLQKIGGDVQ